MSLLAWMQDFSTPLWHRTGLLLTQGRWGTIGAIQTASHSTLNRLKCLQWGQGSIEQLRVSAIKGFEELESCLELVEGLSIAFKAFRPCHAISNILDLGGYYHLLNIVIFKCTRRGVTSRWPQSQTEAPLLQTDVEKKNIKSVRTSWKLFWTKGLDGGFCICRNNKESE